MLFAALLFCSHFTNGQAVTAPDCDQAINVCTDLGFTITTNGVGNINEIPVSGTVSNPSTPPTGTGVGCLLGGEINSTWMVVNIASNGQLEFTFGGNGTQAGFYDWMMWPYTPGTTCNGIINNTVAPVACNWNASSLGGTGMGPVPAGANAGNYVPGLPVTAGQQYIICFTNYSGVPNTVVPLDFTGSASVSCFPVNQFACLGDSVQLTVGATLPNSTFLWSPPAGLSSTTDSVVMASPAVTTDYTVTITDPGGNFIDTTVTVTIYNPPTPDAGADDFSCSLQYTLNATLSDTFPGTWTFTGPGGTTAFFVDDQDPNTAVQVSTTGLYGFIFTEDNGLCPAVSDTVWIDFMEVPHANITVNPTCGLACDGTVDIDAPTGVMYSIDNGVTFQVDSFFTGLCATTYDVVVQNIQGCQGTSQFTLVDPTPVTLSVSNDTIVCIDGTAIVTATAGGGNGIYTYVWDQGLPDQAVHNIQPTASGCYIVHIEDGNGCMSPEDTICVGLYAPLVLTVSPQGMICPGDPITIGAGAVGGIGAPYTYNWSDGGTWSSGGDSITVSPTTPTDYCVTVTDGCETPSAAGCVNVGLHPVPDIGVTVDIDSMCVPFTSTFTNTTSAALNGTAVWDFGNGDSSSDPMDVINAQSDFNIPGCYDLRLTVTSPNGCVADTMIPQMVCGYGYPTAQFDMTPQPTTVNHTEITFINNSFDNFYNDWTFDTLGTSNVSEPVFTFPNLGPGVYPVWLVVTNEYGCQDSVMQEVVIQEDFLIYVPNAFTPNGDGLNDFFEVKGNDIDPTLYEMTIFDRWGNIVFRTEDVNTFWDGTMLGSDMVQIDTYVWMIKTRGISNQEKYEVRGHVTVVR